MPTLLAPVSTQQYHGDILFSMIPWTLLIYDSENTVGLIPGP